MSIVKSRLQATVWVVPTTPVGMFSTPLELPTSAWSHSPRISQLGLTIHSRPRPATQPPLVLSKVAAKIPGATNPLKPHPATRQSAVTVNELLTQAQPAVP